MDSINVIFKKYVLIFFEGEFIEIMLEFVVFFLYIGFYNDRIWNSVMIKMFWVFGR